jgi:hypothetical protein
MNRLILFKALRERNNFSTLMAFVGGMFNAAVARLKWTRASLSRRAQEQLAELEALMKSESSYKVSATRIHLI